LCPVDRRELRRSDYSTKFSEEKEYERDLEIRAKVLAVYNKPRDLFASRTEYYDYLE
jgi:hypothetical protein